MSASGKAHSADRKRRLGRLLAGQPFPGVRRAQNDGAEFVGFQVETTRQLGRRREATRRGGPAFIGDDDIAIAPDARSEISFPFALTGQER
jgi:hypothetical protein